jgi:hypothetical protein
MSVCSLGWAADADGTGGCVRTHNTFALRPNHSTALVPMPSALAMEVHLMPRVLARGAAGALLLRLLSLQQPPLIGVLPSVSTYSA